MSMIEPPPMRPVHECATCKWASSGYGATLCTWGSMARKVEVNRDTRGVCGPNGRMWRAKEDSHGNQ